MSKLSSLLPASLRRWLRRWRKADPQKEVPRVKISSTYNINVADGGGLKGRVAVVVGGSGEIGRAIGVHLAAHGATVYICGTSLERARKVVEEIESLGGVARAAEINLLSEDSIVGAAKGIFDSEGRIDIWVNSAGGSAREQNARMIDMDASVLRQTIEVNLTGTILCCREAARHMVETGGGRIICIGSIIGDQGKSRFSDYAAAKAGIAGFCRSLAIELGESRVTVNCVSPGIVKRGWVTEQQIQKLRSTNWMASYCRFEDIASAVLYLASDSASFVTGQNLRVDGGRSLGLKGDS